MVLTHRGVLKTKVVETLMRKCLFNFFVLGLFIVIRTPKTLTELVFVVTGADLFQTRGRSEVK